MNKTCLIYQPCGLGDILFCLKLANIYAHKGYRVFWPVIQEYENLNSYIPWINWISWQDKDNKLTHRDKLPDNIIFPHKEDYDPYKPNIVSDDFVYINGFHDNGFSNAPIMARKYLPTGYDFSDWAEYVSWVPNEKKEKELQQILGLDIERDEYIFINRNYQMRPKPEVCNAISNNPNNYGRKIVEMQIIPGFSIFDWAPIISKAKSIRMIETSLCYIMQSPQMRDSLPRDIELYSRHSFFGEVEYLFKPLWKYNR